MSVIQQVYLKDSGYSLYIKSLIPDEENPITGEIIFNGNPTKLERKERYSIEGAVMITENFTIPMNFIVNFLIANDFTKEVDEEQQVYLGKVLFKLNN